MQKLFVGSVCVCVMAFGPSALASHPHQAICLVTAADPDADGNRMSFLLQIESAREYVKGTPEEDVHDYRYQVRICDDDNDSPRCSTYQSSALTHASADEVTLVGMKNKSAVFFRGRFTEAWMEGMVVRSGPRDGRATRTLVPFKARLDNCIAQSWVKLTPEANSNAH